jgi:diguanylate cyclase (GGDEF)-like protein/PAS domain S-box-containing protein
MNDIHVLFVDDEPDILSALNRLMGRENYAVHFAGSGADALDIMAATPIHIIVSDMKMPEMDGLTLLKQVKQFYPDTVRMALSANIQFDQLLHCINTGEIFRYITKPTKPEELKQALRDAMDYFLVRKDRISLVLELQDKNEKLRQVLEQEKKIEQQLRMNQVELEISKSRYFDLYDLAPVGYCTICEKGVILEANLTAATLLGMTRSSLINQPISRFIVDADQDIYSCHCKQLFEKGELPICELRMTKMDGTVFWAHIVATIAQDAEDVAVSRLVMSDITETKRMEAALQESEKKYRYIVETAIEGVASLDIDDRLSYVNKQMARMLGYSVEEMLGRKIESFLAENQRFEDEKQKTTRRQGRGSVYELCAIRKDGRRHWLLISAKAITDDDGRFAGSIGMITDINDRKLAEQALQEANRKLELLSNTDGLTGIFNRRYFNEKLAIEFERLSRSNRELSLIMMDIDHFKDYNDYYGHIAGDDCLRQVAEMIQTGISRSADFCARYGGEEFVCVLPETDKQGAGVIAEKLRHGVESLCIAHKTSLTSNYVTISLGVATVRYSSTETANDFINKADTALYQSKKNGRNRVTHFSIT